MYSSVEKPPPQRELFRQSECTAVLLLFFMPKFIAHGGVTIYHYMCLDTCNERCYTVEVGITEETEETT